MAKVVYNGEMDSRLCKEVLGKLIPQLAAEDPDVVYLDADLMSCIGTLKWGKTSDRAIECGIAEANMIGVAAGLAAQGFKPICHSFGPFASRRCFDQLFLSAGYAKNDITVIGTDPGVTATMNGGTHMPFEDVALYNTIPTATILEPSDATSLESLLKQCPDHPGVKYIRIGRKLLAKVYDDVADVKIGKANTLREGKDVAIFAAGIMVHEAMQAAEALEKEGISAAVIDNFTLKPLDKEAITKYAAQCGAIVVAENANRMSGTYANVLQLLADEGFMIPTGVVAINDEFGEVGKQDYLQERFGLTAAHIISEAKKAIARKK